MKKLWLIGLGGMGLEYAKVLLNIKKDFIPIGRSKKSSDRFNKFVEQKAFYGGLNKFLEKSPKVPESVIISVNVENLFSITNKLINYGVKNILLEKPGGADSNEISLLSQNAKRNKINLFIAYNRRFYSSVNEVRRIINNDGGLLSFYFDFTEVVNKIEKIELPLKVKQKLILANSTHILDLVFFIGGSPKYISAYHQGEFDWHKSGAIFNGSGLTDINALFSYSANWHAPGRWGIKFFTKNNKIILEPLERLSVQQKGSFDIKLLKINDSLDKEFKPGLFKMVNTFLNKDFNNHCSIDYHNQMMPIYYKIANYN